MLMDRALSGFGYAALAVLLWFHSAADLFAETVNHPRILGGIESVPATKVAEEILREAYGRLGIPIKVQYLPNRRVRYMARLGRLDGDLFRVRSIQPEYTRMLRVPAPLLTGYIHCVVRGPEDLHLCDDPASLEGPVAKLTGVRVEEEYVEETGLDILPVERYEQIADLLRHGRVRMGLVSSIEGIAPFDRPGWEGLIIRKEPLKAFTLYHYMHSRYQEDVDRLAETLAQMRESGWTEQVINRFITEHQDRMLVYQEASGPEGE